MTPETLGTAEWNSLTALLFTLWLFAFVTVFFAINLLLGHAILPSLAYTDQLPRWLALLRPLFYVAALLALGVDIFLILLLGNQLGILQMIYPRFLI